MPTTCTATQRHYRILMPNRILTPLTAFHGALVLFKARLLKKRTPLLISWDITFRCNQKCKYCGTWASRCPELSTGEVLRSIDEFYKLGTRWITFTGGEPLLRDDLQQIVGHAKNKGIRVFVSSNGWRVPEKIAQLKACDRITLSLDGPADVHDSIRGEGSFSKVIEAVVSCRDNRVPVGLTCVLSKYNLGCVDHVINIASKQKIKVIFQPARRLLAYSSQPNPVIPPVEGYRQTMEKLIRYKKTGAPIANSLTGLRHLSRWPSPTRIWCSAGVLACNVEPDGFVVPCEEAHRFIVDRDAQLKKSVRDRFFNLSSVNCSQCWCAPFVEINLISSFDLEPLLNLLAL